MAEGRLCRPHPRHCAAHLLERDTRVARRNSPEGLDDKVDHLVAQLGEEMRFPVVQPSCREARVNKLLDLHVGARLDLIRERRAEAAQRANRLFSRRDGSIEDRPHAYPRGSIGTVAEVGVDDERVCCAGCELTVEAQHLARGGERVREAASEQDRTDGMQLELKLGHDTEVATTATESPEEVALLR